MNWNHHWVVKLHTLPDLKFFGPVLLFGPRCFPSPTPSPPPRNPHFSHSSIPSTHALIFPNFIPLHLPPHPAAHLWAWVSQRNDGDRYTDQEERKQQKSAEKYKLKTEHFFMGWILPTTLHPNILNKAFAGYVIEMTLSYCHPKFQLDLCKNDRIKATYVFS